MSTYTIIPGRIAPVCHVNTPEGEQWGCIYLDQKSQPELSPSEEALLDRRFTDLPLPVRAAVNRHFGTVFALPEGRREGYINSCVPWTVEVE